MKRVFVLLLTFVMVIGLSACVGGESGKILQSLKLCRRGTAQKMG